MIAVIFEAWPSHAEEARYFDLAAALRPKLDTIDGFISIERFRSVSDPRKLLSLSFWRDESAVAKWRNTPTHRATQKLGRNGVFSDYRLRIADVTRNYGMFDRDEAPDDSQAAHQSK